MTKELNCFKAYDVRGQIPNELNSDVAYRIGRAYAQYLQPKQVVVGYDIRLSSEELCNSLIDGLLDAGVDVINIGRCGTEDIYFATSYLETDGGIVVTASHNPADYNGMKFVRENSKPISGDTGLFVIKELAENNQFSDAAVADERGKVTYQNVRQAYLDHLLGYIDVSALKPLKIVCNAGNGGAGAVIDLLESSLPFEFIKIHHEADGNFPNGVPNPLLVENRHSTIKAIQANQADLGIAWDGDFDRCFFFDESGRFIDGYYIVGLLAQSFLDQHPGSSVIYDPRLIWNTIDIAEASNSHSVVCKTGHAFIKEKMRSEDAIYGGEMSAHHYFRDFFYCDSGMIPWLLVVEMLSKTGKPLSELVNARIAAFPASGEINTTIKNPPALIKAAEEEYKDRAKGIDRIDGLSMDFGDWRFNLRMSATEPVVRLNVESRGDQQLMEQKTKELLTFMSQH